MTKRFKICHFSDLHLTALDNGRRSEPKLPHRRLRGMNEAFRTVLRSIKVQKSDLILITGDVTDKGDYETWLRFNEILKSADVREKTKVVIGNHDVCGMKGFVRPMDKRLLKTFDIERLRRSMTTIGFRHDYPWAEKLNEEIVIFGIDSNNSGNVGALDNAIGRIGRFQLEAFARLLKTHKETPVKIVALHHSPNIPGRATQIQRKGKADPEWVRFTHEIPKEDRWALRFLCLSHGVRLIVHGHLHEQEDRRVNGIRIIGAPSTTQPVENELGESYRFYRYIVVRTSTGRHRISTEVCQVRKK